MIQTVEQWIRLNTSANGSVKHVLKDVAERGEWQSILNAHEAGLFAPEVASELRVERLVSAFSVLDSVYLDPALKPTVFELLRDLLEDTPQQDKDVMLVQATRDKAFLLETCRALIKLGGDPYAPAPEDKQNNSCINSIFIRGNDQQGLLLLGVLFGDGPITSPDQLPARFSSGSGQWAEQLNLLEQCSLVSRFDLTDSIVARIVPGSAGENILFDLGDKVMKRLWLEPDGKDRIGAVFNVPTAKSADVSRAIHYLAVGAKLRDPAMWSKVAHKNLRDENETVLQLIDWIASDIDKPAFKQSAAATSRRKSTPRILDVFFEHGAVSVDEIILDRKSLLMHAAAQNEPSWVAHLLERGADPSLKSACGRGKKEYSASEIAAANGAPECTQMIDAFIAKRAISQVLDRSRQPDVGR